MHRPEGLLYPLEFKTCANPTLCSVCVNTIQQIELLRFQAVKTPEVKSLLLIPADATMGISKCKPC